MKNELPANHGLSATTISNLLFSSEDGRPELSNVQYSALHEGVGRGESMLVVSPTSTGKTLIALLAIANSLESSCNTVYLVTHRALAKQKFEDFRSQMLPTYLDGDGSSLVLATGDYVLDSDGEYQKDPLGARLLVATYEKYLALLSSSGLPTSMQRTVVVCDEIQLIGDASRGQNVEVLLTLLKNAGWKQFVGLSAVLQAKDASELAGWLGVKLVLEHTREKHLRYECWGKESISIASSEKPGQVESDLPKPLKVESKVIPILQALLNEAKPPLPIIVFCMKKQDTYDLAEEFLRASNVMGKGQLSLAFDELPQTSANAFLAKTLGARVASHNADLTDEERDIVEQHLLEGKLDVVFATSTLAAGVNFPLGAAIFASWKRWNSNSRAHIEIDPAEFHNMAGRVGRMGFSHDHGRVIFIAESVHDIRISQSYLNLGELPELVPRVNTKRLNQLALQLVASGLCSLRADLERLICSTFSALRAQDKNLEDYKLWPSRLKVAIDNLILDGLLIETSAGILTATPVGKAVGFSGLLPETCNFLLDYLINKSDSLIKLFPSATLAGDIPKLAFLVFSACYSSPEFRSFGSAQPTRFLPYPLNGNFIFDASPYQNDLIEPVWQADPMPINAAALSCEWIEGAEIRHLESSFPQLSAGMLHEMHRNLVWVLQGLAGIITAASDKRVANAMRPKVLQNSDIKLEALAKLPRIFRRLSFREAEGLPDDVLWLTSLNQPNSSFRLNRTEILGLRARGLYTPEQIMLSSEPANSIRVEIFAKAKPTPYEKSNWLRDACRSWKSDKRKSASERHIKRALRCPQLELVKKYYDSKEVEFENVFEDILRFLNISYQKLDDKTKTGAPDYLLMLKESPPLIVELKSKQGDKLVEYNKAVDVLSASEIHGYKNEFCVTLCHPGVDPSVPLVIMACGRLSVVESHDLGEALIRLCEGTLSQTQLWQWLAIPGQALSSDLPYREYG